MGPPLSRLLRTLLIGLGVTSVLIGLDVYIGSLTERQVPIETLTICRATGVPTHPYQPVDATVAPDGSIAGTVDLSQDVVPPYSYLGKGYPGANWTAHGQAIWYAGCQASTSKQGSTIPAIASPGQAAVLPQVRMRPAPDPEHDATQILAGSLMVAGLVMIAFGAIRHSPRRRRPTIELSSDLSIAGVVPPRTAQRWPIRSVSAPKASAAGRRLRQAAHPTPWGKGTDR
jgi:hypothetical protein